MESVDTWIGHNVEASGDLRLGGEERAYCTALLSPAPNSQEMAGIVEFGRCSPWLLDTPGRSYCSGLLARGCK